MTIEQADLLRAVASLQSPEEDDDASGGPATIPGTKAVGQAMLATWKARGGPYAFKAYAPWHGTDPHIHELRAAGYVEVHVGMAQFHHPDSPAKPPEQYWLEITASGRQVLAEYDAAS